MCRQNSEAELKRIVSIAAVGAALISAQAAASDLPSSEAKAGKEAIELHYINQKIYSPSFATSARSMGPRS